MTDQGPWHIERGDGPLVAAAIHDGSYVREEVGALLALAPGERLREEDPHTAVWTALAPTRIVGRRSRFEFDLNRPRHKAVYVKPEDAWGLDVWRQEPPADVVERSLALYDAFYAEVHALLREQVDRHGRAVVLDLHSYNHRRGAPGATHADPETHPEVNVGTGSVDRACWASVVERFCDAMRRAAVRGRTLDVRENVKFTGGHFPQWIHANFPRAVCCLAIEVKKTFMDEWSGTHDPDHVADLGAALASAAGALVEELERP